MQYSFFKQSALCSLVVLLVFNALPSFADYSKHPKAEEFVDLLVNEHKLDRAEVVAALSQAQRKDKILKAISRPAEKTKPWFEYRKIFLGQSRIDKGVEFWLQHREVIARAAEAYKVDPQIIVAIIGVETLYGHYRGSYRVLDALATLGFDYSPRSKFFRSELKHFFLLAKEQKQDIATLMGSYAGAMGYGQFIPSSYRRYAVDFDGDKIADIWSNVEDAVGSVANYFAEHKWQYKQPVMTPSKIAKNYENSVLNSRVRPKHTLADLAKLGYSPKENRYDAYRKAVPLMYESKQGKEYMLGFDNFYVITRYNRSQMYARAVWELSNEILAGYNAKRVAKVKS